MPRRTCELGDIVVLLDKTSYGGLQQTVIQLEREFSIFFIAKGLPFIQDCTYYIILVLETVEKKVEKGCGYSVKVF